MPATWRNAPTYCTTSRLRCSGAHSSWASPSMGGSGSSDLPAGASWCHFSKILDPFIRQDCDKNKAGAHSKCPRQKLLCVSVYLYICISLYPFVSRRPVLLWTLCRQCSIDRRQRVLGLFRLVILALGHVHNMTEDGDTSEINLMV